MQFRLRYRAGVVLVWMAAAHAQTVQTGITVNFSGTVTGIYGADDQAVSGTGTIAPYGNMSMSGTRTNFNFTLTDGDTLSVATSVTSAGSNTVGFALTFTAGTGVFKGVSGTGQLTVTCETACSGSDGQAFTAPYTATGSGTLLLPPPPPAALTVVPGILNFSGQAGSSTPLEQTLTVQNSGGGSLAFRASIVSGSPWVSIAPVSGTVSQGNPAAVTVTVNAQALSAGSYQDVIQFASAANTVNVPVSLFASAAGAVIWANPTGVLFNMVQGQPLNVTQSITISDQGSPGTTVNWTAAPAANPGVPSGNFLAFASASSGGQGGQAQPGSPGSLNLSLNASASNLSPGVYYELVQVSAPTAQNSPQYVSAVLNVAPVSASLPPEISPAGLLFTGAAGQSFASQQFTVNWSTFQPQPVQAAVSLPQGQSWLQVTPLTTDVSTSAPGTFTVSVNTAGMSAGVYTGSVVLTGTNVAQLGSVNVTLIVTGGLSGSPVSMAQEKAAVSEQTAAGCTASALVLTETGIPNSFSVPAGWPAVLQTTLTDNCGNAVEGGSVVASFSDGDPPLPLLDTGSGGRYSATWQPSNAAANASVLFKGSSGTLAQATSVLSGVVTANSAPILNANGILNNLNPVKGGALAPGTVAEAFGSSLTTSSVGVSPGLAPLPTAFQQTQLVVGGFLAPLYYLSQTQLDIQIPAELSPVQQYPAVAIVNGALTLPVPVSLAPQTPGVAANSDGSVIAQHNDFSLIDAASPAHPGEFIVIYLTGMGATDPAVASGAVSPGLNPGDQLASAVVRPVVNIGNQAAQIVFAGLTPGAIGLYQINLQVPSGLPAGNLPLTVTQGSVSANATTLPVAVP